MADVVRNGIRVPGGHPAAPARGLIIVLHLVGGSRVPYGVGPLRGGSTRWEQGASWYKKYVQI